MLKYILPRCSLKPQAIATAVAILPKPPQANLAQQCRETLANLEKRMKPQILPLPDLQPKPGFEGTCPEASLSEQTFAFIQAENSRQQGSQKLQESLEKNKKLEALMLLLLKSGQIELALLLFAQLESNEAQAMTSALTEQMQQAQAKRRELTAQMGQVQQGQANSQSQISSVQLGLQEVGDTLQMLNTLIKDVNDQKNRTVEFANNFLNGEHQTTMSVVRGMRG